MAEQGGEQYLTLEELKALVRAEAASLVGAAVALARVEWEEAARAAAREAIPQSLRGLGLFKEDEAISTPGAYPEVLRLGQGSEDEAGNPVPATAYWGQFPAPGFTARGDKVLYKGVHLREYDEEGVIVAPGDEIQPSDYGTQADYAAALATAGHTLQPTWDFVRGHQPEWE
jgi:hypothetical protein